MPAAFDRAGAGLSGVWRATARRLYIGRAEERGIVSAFERRYVDADIDFRWMGGTMATCPLDLWVYQEIVHELAPELIVSTTASARYLAAICHLTGRGDVVWIGAEPGAAGNQPRLREVTAPAGSAEALAQVVDLAADKASVFVVVGAGGDAVLAPEALGRYAALVTQGSFLIVEADASLPTSGDVAAAAVEEILRHDPGFVVDASREKFYLSFSRRGYLRRTGARPALPRPSADL